MNDMLIMQNCDLHTHSNYSDGTYTPAELIAEAEKIGLSAVALCDHNTVSGLPEFLSAAEGKKVKAVAGIEISTDYGKTELHIVGLFIKPEYFARV
ncbi:MAG: PHP domain-containing protein, partial [Clostridia bacterium]|nr:PHP domain-containing protein [Clostridia bacterium]